MTETKDAISRIAHGSRFLHETVEAAPHASTEKLDTLGTCRLKRWQDILRAGPEAIDDRIAAAGWTRTAVEAALSSQPSSSANRVIDDTVPWLRLLEDVLEAGDPVQHLGGCEALPFGELLGGFISVARSALLHRLGGPVPVPVAPGAVADCEMLLAERLSKLLAPCLLAEFDRERPAATAILGLFSSEPADTFGHSQYTAFVGRQRDERLAGLLADYPVAARLAANHVLDWVESTAELFERFIIDHDEIGKALTDLPEQQRTVVSVVGGLSDPHDGGRTVCILECTDGTKVVYKPRSLAPEATWHYLLAAVDPEFVTLAPRVIDRGTYGWMEHAAPADNIAANNLPGFYHRAGVLLALARAFAVTDLHFENVVATSQQLVPVDLETLGQPQRPRPAGHSPALSGEEFGRRFIAGSVLSTLAVPQLVTFANGESADISALADLRDRTAPQRMWAAVGSDAMACVMSDQPIAHQNMPSVHGTEVPVYCQLSDLLAGFGHGWSVLTAERERLLADDGPLARCGDWPVRYLHRPTDAYTRLLALATQPSILRSGIDFSLELEALYARVFGGVGTADELPTIDAESRALQQGDVPRFLTSAASREASVHSEPPAHTFFERSGLEAVAERITSLTPERLQTETRLIDAAISSLGERHNPATTGHLTRRVPGDFGPEEALAAAVELGQSLLDTAILRRDGGIGWVTIAYRAESGGMAPGLSDESFYEGSTGIAVFLAALYRVSGERRWKVAANAALYDGCEVARSVGIGSENTSPAPGMGGLGGLAYGLAIAGAILGDPAVEEEAEALAAKIDLRRTDDTSDMDLMAGRVGAIPAILGGSQFPRPTFASQTVDLSALGREILAGTSSASPAAGYGHGLAGALATLGYLLELDPQLRELLGPSRFLNPPVSTSGHVGWCKGTIGSALGGFVLGQRLGLPLESFADDVESAVAAAIARGDALDQVCCGFFGGVEALLLVAASGRDGAEPMAFDLAARVLDRAKSQAGFRLLAGVPPGFANPGFFQGISGIGYVLLRAARPGVLPSALVGELPA